MNKYTYKVKVRLECERDDCDQTFLREDEHYNSYKMTKKDFIIFMLFILIFLLVFLLFIVLI